MTMKTGRKAVVLLSGGIDSSTTLAVALNEGYEAYALTIDYGQRHRHEVDASRAIAQDLGARSHAVVRVELDRIADSALTGHSGVPRSRAPEEIVSGGGIPDTYVPARNTVFLSLALAWAESLGDADVFIGANAVDYPGYPDCRPEYLEAFEEVAALGTRCGVEGHRIRIAAPLVRMSKAEIIALGTELGVDFSLTSSCYDPVGSEVLACGECDSCVLRRKGFRDSGIEDPTHYAPDGPPQGG